MNFQAWSQTDVGLRREHNEDSFLCDKEMGLYIVADGMGGHHGGEIASQMAVEILSSSVRKAFQAAGSRRLSPRQVLGQAYEEACYQIYHRSQQMLDGRSDLQGMGTTLIAALIYEGTVYIANVGDSRAYLYAHKQIWQLTEDHSLVNEQLKAGLITEADLAKSTTKNIITRSIGIEPEVEVDILERKIQPGDLLLLCSDGLSGMVSDERIEEICRTFDPGLEPVGSLMGGNKIVSVCVDEAKKNGGFDNITVVAVYAERRPN